MYSEAQWERDQESLPGGPGELDDEEEQAAREKAQEEEHYDRQDREEA